ncbi:MAG: hypothetical protein IIY60_11220 [Clostridia bacterium]|nr:hypothetical protein [Clostridia bacterium]
MKDEIMKAWQAAKTDDEKKAVLEKYGAELTQEELETFYGKKLTKEDMEMLAAGNAYQAFYCCAWN